MNIMERQKNIKKNILPDCILYKELIIENKCEYNLLGCRIKYFNSSIPLENLKAPLDKKNNYFRRINRMFKRIA